MSRSTHSTEWRHLGFSIHHLWTKITTHLPSKRNHFLMQPNRRSTTAKVFTIPIIMGELNEKVGNDPNRLDGTLGLAIKCFKNKGERIFNFCFSNDMLVGNSFFPHQTDSQIHERGTKLK